MRIRLVYHTSDAYVLSLHASGVSVWAPAIWCAPFLRCCLTSVAQWEKEGKIPYNNQILDCGNAHPRTLTLSMNVANETSQIQLWWLRCVTCSRCFRTTGRANIENWPLVPFDRLNLSIFRRVHALIIDQCFRAHLCLPAQIPIYRF